jgi:hypothetical protein
LPQKPPEPEELEDPNSLGGDVLSCNVEVTVTANGPAPKVRVPDRLKLGCRPPERLAGTRKLGTAPGNGPAHLPLDHVGWISALRSVRERLIVSGCTANRLMASTHSVTEPPETRRTRTTPETFGWTDVTLRPVKL